MASITILNHELYVMQVCLQVIRMNKSNLSYTRETVICIRSHGESSAFQFLVPQKKTYSVLSLMCTSAARSLFYDILILFHFTSVQCNHMCIKMLFKLNVPLIADG